MAHLLAAAAQPAARATSSQRRSSWPSSTASASRNSGSWSATSPIIVGALGWCASGEAADEHEARQRHRFLLGLSCQSTRPERVSHQRQRRQDPRSRTELLHSGCHRDSGGVPAPFEDDPTRFNAFAEPLPLVVEVWSPTTGRYDLATKLKGYKERGDLEIWYIHPYERTLTVWRRQPDGSYDEALYEGGIVPVVSLPGVSIDLDALLGR